MAQSQPSAKAVLLSAKPLPTACHSGRRQSTVGKELLGKGTFTDGHMADRRQSLCRRPRQPSAKTPRAVTLTEAFADG